MMKTHNDMPIEILQNSDYRKYTTPFVYEDEQWIQISQVYPIISDYYWASNKGRIYSSRYGHCLVADMNDLNYVSNYNHVVLRCKDEKHSERIPLKEFFHRCFGI